MKFKTTCILPILDSYVTHFNKIYIFINRITLMLVIIIDPLKTICWTIKN